LQHTDNRALYKKGKATHRVAFSFFVDISQMRVIFYSTMHKLKLFSQKRFTTSAN